MYQLIYWPFLPGRGEFVRVALEDVGAAYQDVARAPAERAEQARVVLDAVEAPSATAGPPAHFAVPILRDGDITLSQTANILLYLGPRHGLAPDNELGRLAVNQLQLTIADATTEAHNTHHPISSALYYEDQRDAAVRATRNFLQDRLPNYFGYFERVLQQNERGYLVGSARSYADLSLYVLIAGLLHAFPVSAKRALVEHPAVDTHWQRIAARPNIAAYRASDRAMAHNEHGIFRRYEALEP